MHNPLPAHLVAAFTPQQRNLLLATYRNRAARLAARGLDTSSMDAAIAQLSGVRSPGMYALES